MIDKYGNDLDYWYYCPICGDTHLPSFKVCSRHKKMALVKSEHKTEYYRQKSAESIEKYSLLKNSFEFLWEEEIVKNPLYDSEQDDFLKKKREEEGEKVSLYDIKLAAKNQCSAKCPTCGSTNVHKISGIKKVVHGYAFGLFSKTARSQFECNNCGYKW